MLSIAPADCDISRERPALLALRDGDPELALATLLGSCRGEVLHQRIAEETARVLDRGPWQHRMLALAAIEIVADEFDRDDPYETAKARRIEWAHARNLHDSTDLTDYLLVTMCWRRRGSGVFDDCAAQHAERMAVLAPRLFEEVADAARERLDAGQWSRNALSIVAFADVRAGRRADLDKRVSSLLAAWPKRARLISSTVKNVSDERSPSPEAPQPIELPEPAAAQVLGTFEVESPVLTVGDPGYTQPNLHFHRLLIGARTGTWRATVLRAPTGDSQCALLLAHHSAHPCALDEPIWTIEGSIDVEYASAGIFDCAHYYDSKLSAELPVMRPEEHSWFDLCMARAHGLPGPHDSRGAGLIPFGCVSSSGEGDGSYTVYAARALDGGVVGTCIDFRFEAEG